MHPAVKRGLFKPSRWINGIRKRGKNNRLRATGVLAFNGRLKLPEKLGKGLRLCMIQIRPRVGYAV